MSFSELILTKNYSKCSFWDGIKRTHIDINSESIKLPKNLHISLTEYYSLSEEKKNDWEESIKTIIIMYEFKLLLNQYYNKVKNYIY